MDLYCISTMTYLIAANGMWKNLHAWKVCLVSFTVSFLVDFYVMYDTVRSIFCLQPARLDCNKHLLPVLRC